MEEFINNKTKATLLGMILSPQEQFEKIRQNPRILGALVFITFLFVIGMLSQMSYVDPSTLIDEELEGFLEPGDEAMVLMISLIGGAFTALFMPVIIVLVSSFIYWLVAKLVKSQVTFKQLFSMNTYILLINGIGIVFNGMITVFVTKNPDVTVTSLASLVQGNIMLHNILENFELFGIWSLILTAIGLQIVARFSKTAAWTVTIVFFFIGIVFSMVGAAFGMMFGGF